MWKDELLEDAAAAAATATASQHKTIGVVGFVVPRGYCLLLSVLILPKARNTEGLGIKLYWVLFT